MVCRRRKSGTVQPMKRHMQSIKPHFQKEPISSVGNREIVKPQAEICFDKIAEGWQGMARLHTSHTTSATMREMWWTCRASAYHLQGLQGKWRQIKACAESPQCRTGQSQPSIRQIIFILSMEESYVCNSLLCNSHLVPPVHSDPNEAQELIQPYFISLASDVLIVLSDVPCSYGSWVANKSMDKA